MNSKSNIVGLIPARYGSTRLPAKPLVDLCGKPMVQHVYERVSKARNVDRVIVATDHPAIMEAVAKFGGEAVMTPPELQSGSDRIAYVARTLTDASIIVNIQGDEPLIMPEMIDEAIQPLLSDSSVQVATIVRVMTNSDEVFNPNIVKAVLDEHGNALYFSRSPIPHLRDMGGKGEWHLHHRYYKHFGLYVYRKDVLLKYASWEESSLERAERLEQLRILEHGYSIRVAVTEFDSVPVDTAEDAAKVRAILQEQIAAGVA